MEVRPGYKQTEVGVIPGDWEIRPLLSAVRIANGQVDPKTEPYRSMTLVAPDHIESGTGHLLRKETAAEQRAISGKYLFKKGDIVYSKIRPYLRKAILADFDGLCSADMYPLKPASGISGGFVLAAILGHRFSTFAESVSVRSGMPKINRAELAEYAMAFPSTAEEQRVIAAVLSDVDALLGSLDRLITKKRDLKQAAMQELLTGQTRLPGFHGDWEASCLGDLLIRLANGALYRPSNSSGLPVTWIETIADGTIDMSRVGYGARTSELEEYRMRHGDILFSHINSVDHIGKVATYSGEPPLYHGMNLLLLRAGSSLESQFLFYWLSSHQGRKKAVSLARQAVSQASINTSDLKRVEIPLPPLPEQTAIAEVLTDMDAELAGVEQRREKTCALTQAMMQELLIGKTRLV